MNVVPDALSHCKLYEMMPELPVEVPVSAAHDRVTELSEYETMLGIVIALGTVLIFAPLEFTTDVELL